MRAWIHFEYSTNEVRSHQFGAVYGEVKEKGKFQSQKLKNSEKPTGHKVNTSNHHAPGGHVMCSTATMHLIRSETPRVMDSSRKPFIFYGRHDVS